MKLIYRVNVIESSVDGLGSPVSNENFYFEDGQIAEEYKNLKNDSKGWTKAYLYEEFVLENINQIEELKNEQLKIKALMKLTASERKLLGLE